MRRLVALGVCLTALIAHTGVGLAGGGNGQGPRWVTGWHAPAVDAHGRYRWTEPNPLTASYPRGFARQSLRLVVTPHVGGDKVRVVLSNAFGRGRLTIRAATVARRAAGPAVMPSTLRPLTFAGRRSVTVPAGGRVLSDPADVDVAAFQDLAVTLAFDARTGPPTGHYNGLQTSYVSLPGSGDQTTSVEGVAFTASTPLRFFLTDVQVLAPQPGRTIVAVGDSLTDGGHYALDTADLNTRWPDLLQRRLPSVSGLSLANAGISANQVTHDASPRHPAGGPSLLRRFDRDVLSHPNLGGVIVAEGLNDIGLRGTSTAQLVAGYTALARRAHAAGVPILIATLTPMQGAFYDSRRARVTRTQVNAWIRTQRVFDGVVDFDLAVRDPVDGQRLHPAYDSGDHLHPNARGFAAMAQAVDVAAAVRLFGGTPG